MGKAKKRILHKTNSNLYMTREDAVSKVFDLLSGEGKDRCQADKLITLFGLSAEELSEAGVSYEDLVSFGDTIA